jgi:peptidyl-prolyl cis-trans isomerase SurA
MKPFSFLVIAAFFSLNSISAQFSPADVLLTIGNRQVTAGEFERIYNKNYNINSAEKQGVDEYFELFLKFKLKVSAALDAGFDTITSYKKELKGYRDQLAKTYLTDNKAADSLVHEAYNRSVTDVNVSHILILFPDNPTPADTLAAHKKITDIQKKLKTGESFEELAKTYSNDPSAKLNRGKLGYFSAFRFPYLFESCAYQTKVGETSSPLRTSYGYHIVKVNDKRSSPGEIKVAHIMVAVRQNAPDSLWMAAKNKINGIYERLRKGEDFGKLAHQLSDDHNSAEADGQLAWFGTGRMVPEFEQAAFALKSKGDIGLPVKTNFGWHIIQLIDKRNLPSFDLSKNDLKNKIMNDERAEIVKSSFVSQLKKQYQPKSYPETLNTFYGLDSSVYEGKVNTGNAPLTKVALSVKDKDYTLADFKTYLEINHGISGKIGLKEYIDRSFKKFTDETLIHYEDQHLETTYPDFGNLIGEYHDGILLFDIMDKEVWTKATLDTTGLIAFYKQAKTKPVWGERLDASIFTCKTKEIATKIKKIVANTKNKNLTEAQIKKLACDSASGADGLVIEHKLFSKGDNKMIDSIAWKRGLSDFVAKDNHIVFVCVWNIRPSETKSLEDVKGLITADYQNYLEEKWITQLKNRYNITINQDLLHKIANKYKSAQ